MKLLKSNKIGLSLLFLIFIISSVAFFNSDEFLINRDGIKYIKIGNEYSEFIDQYNKTYTVIHKKGSLGNRDAGVFIYENDKLIIKVGNKNWGVPPYIVKHIKIFSNKFHTKDNIHTGMKINDLLKVFPNIKAKENFETGNYIVLPEIYQTKKFFNFGRRIIFEINLNITKRSEIKENDKFLINLQGAEGYISSIAIYDWN